MNNEFIYLIETMSQFIEQGFVLDDIIQLLSSLDQHHFLRDLQHNLQLGYDFDQALLSCQLPHHFKEYYQFFKNNFSISESLNKTLQICKKRQDMKKRLLKKLTYPLFMIVFLFVFSIFIMLYLLPAVEQLFIEFSIEKSIVVSMMFSLFKTIPVFLLLVFVLLITIFSVVVYAVVKQRYQYIDFFIFHTHFIKHIILKYYSLKFAIYYNELLVNHYDVISIIQTLYHQIEDSDIKMVVYELNRLIEKGLVIEDVINQFDYFDEKLKSYFTLIMTNHHQHKDLNDYIQLTLMQIEVKISRIISIFVPLIYAFVAGFVILVYISVIIPMMNVVNGL